MKKKLVTIENKDEKAVVRSGKFWGEGDVIKEFIADDFEKALLAAILWCENNNLSWAYGPYRK